MKLVARIPILAALLLAGTGTAWAQSETPAQTAPVPAPAPDAATDPAQEEVPADTPPPPSTDILSGRTLSILLDARLVAANGHERFSTGGLGITRFSGTDDGDFRVNPLPIEADLIWTPRFTNSLAGNVSVAWQRDQENEVDLLEAFLTFIPQRSGNVSFSAKAGLYWPEISLEHATGGAWSTVHTITPSAINSWIGEEVKVVGAEVSMMATIGKSDFSATAGLFGFNDTSGTLLSFRGWALHDMKATAFGHFDLPPLNDFIVHLQEDRTRSLIELDNRVGFYGRLEWRPPVPVTINAFYYDNRGNPEAFKLTGQWGWRTRFANIGLSAELAPGLRLLAQAMEGTTQMGFKTNGVVWVDTRYRSAYALLAREIGDGEISGRIEAFDTSEHGSEMSHDDEKQRGWALTAAGRWTFNPMMTGFLEVLHVHSTRGTRRVYFNQPPTESQTVVQASLRVRL